LPPATRSCLVEPRRAGNAFSLAHGASITGACRMVKTPAEIAPIQHAMNITMEVPDDGRRQLVHAALP